MTVETYDARVLGCYPHDTSAYTQGLFVFKGDLYESSGREGLSNIRQVDLASGKVLRERAFPDGLFGEGIVRWEDRIIGLTYRTGRGLQWSLDDFRLLGEFRYEGEGWGLTHDGRCLIMSDGTSDLRFLDPTSLRETGRLAVTVDGEPLRFINELEYVSGEIFANVAPTNRIARIDPSSGAVTGWLDITALYEKAKPTGPKAIANGIAYDAELERLYLTGKHWPWLFEVERPLQSGPPRSS